MTENKFPETEKTLVTILHAKDREFAARYISILNQLRNEVQNYISDKERIGLNSNYFADIEENIEKLIPTNLKEKMPPAEIFVLLCGVHFHGIGLLHDSSSTDPATFGWDNDDYLEKTYQYISYNYSVWNLKKHEASCIANVCKGIEAEAFVKLPEFEVIHTSRIRIRFLAALIRLARAINIDYTRVSNHILKLKKLSPASLAQWLNYSDIAGILIDNEAWRITIYIAPRTIEARSILTEFVQTNVQQEFNAILESLTVNGLKFQTIDVQLAHYELLKIKEVVDALQDYYEISESKLIKSPYKFLDFFETRDRKIFFGRRADITRYLGYIQSERLIVLYGESGVGKTSLIRAGLIPEIIEVGFIPVYARCFKYPSLAIREEVDKIVYKINPRLHKQEETKLRDYFEFLGKQGYEFVIFVDQFEEIFIQFPAEVRTEFFQELVECLADKNITNVRFVLSLRREFFVELGTYKDRLLELYNNAYELNKLTAEEIELAIKEPALLVGIQYETNLLKELVQEIFRGGQYNTPHIQIVCDKLFQTLRLVPERTVITLDLYIDLGRSQKILAEYLEAEVNKFPQHMQEKVKKILKEVVSSYGTKIPSTPETIALHTDISVNEIQTLLSDLTNRCRLLRKVELETKSVYELAHEHLVGQVWQWLNKDEIELKKIYELLEQQLIARTRFNVFLDETALKQIEFYRDHLSLESRHIELIVESYFINDSMNLKRKYWLSLLDNKDTIELLLEMMHSDHPETFIQVISEVSSLDLNAHLILINALETSDWQVREGLIYALSTKIPIEKLLDSLKDNRRNVRRGVVCILANRNPELLEFLENPQVEIDEMLQKHIQDSIMLFQAHTKDNYYQNL